jgi:glyoxylase-like metal-dependent hydrolase (beta-lactamase superfamily II)
MIAGSIGLSLPRRAFAGTERFAATPVADDVFVVSGGAVNIVVVQQPDALLLVNGGAAGDAGALMEFLQARFGARPVRVLFNTDWHPHNVGLNEQVARAGGAIVAHENTRLWLGTDISVAWEGRTYKRLPLTARPNQTFYTDGRLTFGGHTMQYGYLGQAHTDGDIYVFLPDANLLAAGDVVTVGRYPVLDSSTGGWIGGIAAATRTLLGLGDMNTRIVPAWGAVQPKAHLQAQSEMLNTVRDRLVKMLKQGLGSDEIIAAQPTKEFDAAWGRPDTFLKNVYAGLWGHARELGGVI